MLIYTIKQTLAEPCKTETILTVFSISNVNFRFTEKRSENVSKFIPKVARHWSSLLFIQHKISNLSTMVSNLQTWLSKTWLSKIDTVDWQNPAPVPGSGPGSGSGPCVAAARCAAAISGPGPDPGPDPGFQWNWCRILPVNRIYLG